MKFVFPNGLTKAMTFSYDDGRSYDRRLVEILNAYDLKGTFHLNSGRLDTEDVITSAEVATLYRGHEVSCHGVEHSWPDQIGMAQLNYEFGEDRRALEKLSGGLVQGMSYAFGGYSETAKQVARVHGLKYARTTRATKNFRLPVDFLEWHPTCHHNDQMELGKRFLELPAHVDLATFSVWGHSYEYGIPDNWQPAEDFAKLMAHRDDIWYATNPEICEYALACRAQEFSADGHIIKNPTAATVWVKAGPRWLGDSRIIAVKPGECAEVE